MIPRNESFTEIQASFRDVQQRLENLEDKNINLKQRRIVNAGASVNAFDYVTRSELDTAVAAIAEFDGTVTGVSTGTGLSKSIVDRQGVFVYDSNGALVHALSLREVAT